MIKKGFECPFYGLEFFFGTLEVFLQTTLHYFIFFLTAINLRSYQVDGVRWLSQCMEIQEGCILGDEMGLGKTCQVSNVME